ncbi:MAG: NUDIX domain-containing protein [Bacteroidaceae bacterium]|nr:NUDIX domain-containing protein [Bacteroidaceae bacterium]
MKRDDDNELFPVVDEQGNVVGKILRGEAHNGCKVLHPVIHLHVFNSRGELYLQHRPKWKLIQPDRWDTACGGHVAYGESIGQAFEREVAEELGIKVDNAESLGSYTFESAREREFVHVFKTVYDGPINPDKDELDGGRFWSRQDILDSIGTGVLTPNFESEYMRFFQDPAQPAG